MYKQIRNTPRLDKLTGPTKRKLDLSDIATILAALRCFQQHLELNGGLPGRDFKAHFSHHPCLGQDEIDTLCQEINFDEVNL